MSVNHDILEAKYRWREEKWLQPPTANDRVILWNKTKCGVQSGDMESHFTGNRNSQNSHFPLWLWHCCQASDYYYIAFDEKIPIKKLHPGSMLQTILTAGSLKDLKVHWISFWIRYIRSTNHSYQKFIHISYERRSGIIQGCYCQRMSLV